MTKVLCLYKVDDDEVMAFVASAAIIRMNTYKIPLVSHFRVKEMAGNIVPAIASTNSIVSGIEITESCKYFSGNASRLKWIQVNNTLDKVKSYKQAKP